MEANKGMNKSQTIREAKKRNPTLKPKALSEVLKADYGLEVEPGYISTILSQAKKLGGKTLGKRGRPAGSMHTGTTTENATSANTRGDELTINGLLHAKKLIAEMGGVSEAKKAVDAMSKLM
jgi:hypothetical protein